ncbi:hypothetical protein CF328_g7608 [Tilletia controversa]|nr:hypothetical protein CF328_g7608 [Tilletia controversa]
MSNNIDDSTGHNRQDLNDANLFLFCSQHWRDHHGNYRHGSDYTHEHVHIHKRDLFAPGARGTVAVLLPLVGSLLGTGLTQQVATLVLAPLSSDAAAPATGIKLMLVDSFKQVMIKPSNMSDWRQVQLQATVFNLATASDPLATAASTASGVAAGSGTGAAAAADVPPTAADDAGDN